jgi:hypothetical protein
MSVGKTSRIEDPKVLIETLSNIPYSSDERIADIRASGMELLKNVFAPLLFPLERIRLFVVSNDQMFTDPSALLTSDTISKVVEEHFADSKEKIQISEKLTYISNKVQEYAQKTNLGKIDLYFDPNTKNPVLAQAYQVKNNSIEIGHEIFEYSSEAIDWLVAHELMHIKHNDCLKELGFSCSTSILYVIFLLVLPWFYSIPLILLTNGVASLFFNTIRKKHEEEADKGAIDFLQTNTGMIKFISAELWRNLDFKYAPIELWQKFNPHVSLERVEKIKSVITHIGNYRCDFDHPPLTERLAMALDFVPKAQLSQ